MFSLIDDKAFSIKTSRLEKDFYLNSKVMTFPEAQNYCKNFDGYESYFVPINQTDENTFSGVVYVYRNGQSFKKASVIITTNGLGLISTNFIENYEGKLIKLGKIYSIKSHQIFDDENGGVGGIIIQADEIYNELDWQNHLALLRAEEDWLQPDEF